MKNRIPIRVVDVLVSFIVFLVTGYLFPLTDNPKLVVFLFIMAVAVDRIVLNFPLAFKYIRRDRGPSVKLALTFEGFFALLVFFPALYFLSRPDMFRLVLWVGVFWLFSGLMRAKLGPRFPRQRTELLSTS